MRFCISNALVLIFSPFLFLFLFLFLTPLVVMFQYTARVSGQEESPMWARRGQSSPIDHPPSSLHHRSIPGARIPLATLPL
jgi:hypothetical protein